MHTMIETPFLDNGVPEKCLIQVFHIGNNIWTVYVNKIYSVSNYLFNIEL